MTPKTSENAVLMVTYFRTWRLWRIIIGHEYYLQTLMNNTSELDDFKRLRASKKRWATTCNKVWRQRSELLQKITDNGITYTPN